MTVTGIRRAAGQVLNGILRPLGFEVSRPAVLERARRATHAGALQHIKSLGFSPRTVIDVGVADGTPPLYQAFPSARHVLIEPVEECRPFLDAISRQFPHVEYVVAAAAREPGRVIINVHRDVARSSVYWESDYGPGSVVPREVPAVTLDQVRQEKQLEPPILLKIDVQGAEVEVLAGAPTTLTDTEYVLLEASLLQFFRGAPLIADVVEYLRRQEFVIYDVVALQYRPFDGALTMVDLAFVKESGSFRSVHRFHSSTSD